MTHEGRAEGSGKRIRGPTNRNRIQGVVDQGEWATNHEALVINEKLRKSGGRAEKVSVLTRADLALCLKGDAESRREKSGEAIVGG